MLVIKVELWPFGDKSQAKEIARCNVFNTGGNYTDGFDYGVELNCDAVPHLGIEKIIESYSIKGHDRLTPLPGLLGRVFERFIPVSKLKNNT